MFRELTFPGFVRLSRASRNASRRNTDRGRLIQAGALVCAALGVDMDLTLIYKLFTLLFCIIVASRFTLLLGKPRVSVKRHLPRYATANEPFTYRIEVSNTGDRVERDLTLADNPTVIPPTIEQFRRRREPGEESRNAYDRWLGFHRFVWLQRLNTGIQVTPSVAAEIPLKSRRSVEMEAAPLRRGVVHFDAISVQHPDPFGLNYGITNFAAPDQLLVLPQRYPVPARFETQGGRHFQPGGFNASWSIGESDEFVSLRDYRDGDSMRKIHWPSTARRTKPVVKEYQDEYFVRQALVLDTCTEVDEILEAAVSVAASFAVAMNRPDSMLDLVYLSTKPEIVTAGHGATSLGHQMEALAGLQRTPLSPSDLSDAVLAWSPRLSSCVVVLTDWCEIRREMIAKLTRRATPVEVLLIGQPADFEALPTRVKLIRPGHLAEDLASL